MIGIINYGAGNLRSVRMAFEKCGADANIIEDPSDLNSVSSIILPGVGSFKSASETLHSNKWDVSIKQELARGKKLMGICLGMQLLMDWGEEGGRYRGLGLIRGEVVRMDKHGERLPHVGWNQVNWISKHPMVGGVRDGLDFYHVHSYECKPRNNQDIIGFANYGNDFVTAIGNEQVIGFQFHPEKSQPVGLELIRKFMDWSELC
jgi:glutamine amidotransferase